MNETHSFAAVAYYTKYLLTRLKNVKPKTRANE